MRQRVVAVVMLASLAVLAPVWAGDRPIVMDSPDAPALILPPAESGKPLVPPRPAGLAPSDPEACVSPLPCGTRLLGSVRKDGAVEVQVPALRW